MEKLPTKDVRTVHRTASGRKLLEQKRLRNVIEFQVFLENDSVRKTVERSECCGCFLKQKQASTSQKTKHSVAILKLASKLCCFVKDEV